MAVYNESLSFPPCTTQVCLNISTHDDALPEGNEQIYVTLSRGPNLDSGIYLDPATTMAAITIVDNDGELLHSIYLSALSVCTLLYSVSC